MGKLLLAALFGGLVSAALTFFLMTTLATGEQATALEKRLAEIEKKAGEQSDASEVAAKRLDLLARNVQTAAREQARSVARLEEELSSRPAVAAGDGSSAGPGAAAPDGTPYVSRKELEAAIEKARSVGQIPVDFKPIVQKSLEEIAQDMGLSSSEEVQARTILRDSEQELVTCLFGDRPFNEIAAEVKAAKEDPDKMQSMVTEAASRAFSNIGKLMTIETRTKRKLADALGKDKARDLMSRPRKPILGDEWQDLFKDFD